MSRHQAVRNLDYQKELDDYDEGYSDEEELSAEDQTRMRQGTADVRASLGESASIVTTKQIEEALWHYFYDVDKTVAYLVGKFIAPPEPKKPKAVPQKSGKQKFLVNFESVSAPCLGFSDERLEHYSPDTTALDARLVCPRTARTIVPWPHADLSPPVSLAQYFDDMPWGNIPKHRETVFIEPSRPRGGLLGGSSATPKLSKLQQLAAARKKKVDDKKAEGKVEGVRSKMDKLELSSPLDKKENMPPPGPNKRLKLAEATFTTPKVSPDPDAGIHKVRPSMLIDSGSDDPTQSDDPASTEDTEGSVKAEPAKPSGFAKTLFGDTSDSPARPRQELFGLPFATHPAVLAAFSGPSPDDVVLTAQAKAGKRITPAPATKKGANPNLDDLKALRIQDTPLPKSKNLDVVSEFERSTAKKTASFVVVGHVDAGKSTMMGRLLLDLKVVDQRTVDKLRQEAEKIGKSSFALAWVLDQRSEERARGVTIDIATNRFETDTTAFTMLDAPGHQDFIPNMIAGASQADFAILVIDASVGAFESGLKGQTKEHSLLLRSMGVSRLIVAVNKLDMVQWSRERYDEITQQVSGFLTVTGFQMKKTGFVPVSGLNGDNLVRRSTESAASWYTGPTLLEELEASEPSARDLAKPLRLSISEVFRTQQSPVSVSGRVESGSLQMGDALLVQPSGEKAYVKSLLVDDELKDWAVAGQNIVIHLSNIDPIHVRVGDIICDPADPILCMDTFALKALAFDFLMPMQLDVHRGRLHSAGRVEEITALLDKATGTVIKKKPKVAKPGSVARIIVKLSSKVPLEAGQRVHLRSGGKTIAAGLLE